MKHSQSGFSLIEILLGLVILAGFASVVYFVRAGNNYNQTPISDSLTTSKTELSTSSDGVLTPTPPTVTNAPDLKNVLIVLNQTNINASNNDSTQLSNEAIGL